MDSYKQLTELYNRRKEEQAKMYGALESYNAQRERLCYELKTALESLAQATSMLSDVSVSQRAQRIVDLGNRNTFSPEDVTAFGTEIKSLVTELENELRELLDGN